MKIKKIGKLGYIIIGCITLILGMIGILLPILPTTPFLLLTSFCFVKGSPKFDRWFKSTKVYKKYLENYVVHKEMTLKEKIRILLVADSMLLVSILLINHVHVRIFLVFLMLIKFYYFIFKIKTKK